MSIRKRLLILSLLMFCSLATITGLALWNWNRLQSLNHTILLGQQLQTRSRNVIGLMKDITFDLFAPRMYGQIRALTYAPRSVAAYREWMKAVGDYQSIFNEFIVNRELTILQNDELQDLYMTALTLNEKALEKLYNMSEIMNRLQNMDTGGTDLYIIMQKDETLIPFFDEFRETSFYFTNTFQSYMNHFFSSFKKQSERLEQELYLQFLLISILSSALALGYALVISRQILHKIQNVGTAFKNIARGDFSTTYESKDRDELSALLLSINELSTDLKENINSILNLTRDMGQARPEETSLKHMLQLTSDAIIKDTRADTAAVYLYNSNDDSFKLRSCSGKTEGLPPTLGSAFPRISRLKKGEAITAKADRLFLTGALGSVSPGDAMTLPLKLKGESIGFLLTLMRTGEERFSDLGVTRMVNFSEYVSLTLENHLKYGELLENREAQYWALQSQVQPHFIYNILSGFIGLNRMGATERLEKAILSLREMLRYVTDQKHLTSLKDEVNFLKNYCDLQKIRFSERLEYDLIIDEKLGDFMIPRLLLQPLVENAVIHGLEPLEEGGSLRLRAEREEGHILIKIEDDGCGFDPQTEREGVGTRNVRERLAMAFPGSEMVMNSRIGEGTELLIRIKEREGEAE